MENLSVLDVVLTIGVLHGVFLVIVILSIQERNKAANKILALILLTSVLMLLGRINLLRFQNSYLFYVAVFADTTIFLFGSLVYMYIRRLIYNESPVYKLRKIDYLPAILHLVFSIWYITIPKETLILLYKNKIMTSIHVFFELSAILLLAYYLIRTYIVHRNYESDIKENLSNFQSSYNFVSIFLYTLFGCLFLWMFSFINATFLQYKIPVLDYNSIWIFISIFIYVIGYYSIRQPEIFRATIKNKQILDKNRLSPEAIRQLQNRLTFLMIEEEIFLKPDLTLKLLSEELNTTTNNLSWLLNNVYKVSFYEYVNSFRIEKYLKKIESGEHNKVTLLSIALDVGFNSKSTFNRFFKSKTGLTPTKYLKQEKTA